MEGLSCLHKVHGPQSLVAEQESRPSLLESEEQVKEASTDTPASNKKTDEVAVETPLNSGYVWRFSSGLVNTTASAIGLGVNGIKWVVGKGYNAGSAVVGTTKTVVCKVPAPAFQKDKKE